MVNPSTTYCGLLVIGDPHLESRQPGFRKDDYPQAVLGKVDWCVNYALQHRLLPVFLGDIFDKPRDNPNWMLVKLIEMLSRLECVGIYGNHDCADPAICEHDSLTLLTRARCITLLDIDHPWRGVMNDRLVVVGGSSYRQPIPKQFDPTPTESTNNPLVVWLTHHDLTVPGYEVQGHFTPREIDRIDIVINGHIHRKLESVQVGRTLWITPGNISRRSRSDATRDHIPAVLRLDISPADYEVSYIVVPHESYADVFHDIIVDDTVLTYESAFVKGLAELQMRKTSTGAGLMSFLEQNVNQFEPTVANEIMQLANEVTINVETIECPK